MIKINTFFAEWRSGRPVLTGRGRTPHFSRIIVPHWESLLLTWGLLQSENRRNRKIVGEKRRNRQNRNKPVVGLIKGKALD
jgi:hypothetical protein